MSENKIYIYKFVKQTIIANKCNKLIFLFILFFFVSTQEFSEAATMLSATCDEFLKNLCDCMELADSNFSKFPHKRGAI